MILQQCEMTQLGQYSLRRKLGSGAYGEVHLAESHDGQLVAIKSIHVGRRCGPTNRQRVSNETSTMRLLRHKNIIALKEIIETSDCIHVVMEYANGGDIRSYLNTSGPLPETQARSVFGQLLSAVRLAHQRGVVHRDLKLDNILLDSLGEIKLADWGLAAKWSPESRLTEFVGSAHYAAPEIILQRPYVGPEADCWSLGVILYGLVAATLPFNSHRADPSSDPELRRQICGAIYPQPPDISPSCASLIAGLLTVDSHRRFTVDDAAQHPWMACSVLSIPGTTGRKRLFGDAAS